MRSPRSENYVATAMSEFFVGNDPHRIYVQHWHWFAPASESRGPVVLVHGGFHSGIVWTTTPDGRPGWAQLLAAAGWDVYVIDWPGTGRSGRSPDSVSVTAATVVDGLAALVEHTGPAVMIGHSIGAALSFKLAERQPGAVRAIAAVAPASVESPVAGWDSAPLDEFVYFPEPVVRSLFANSDAFPHEAFDNYMSSVVPSTPAIFNASLGLSEDLKTDPTVDPGWGDRIPVLLLVADQDQLIPEVRSAETSAALGVPVTRLADDWGLPGHGHNLIVETGSEAIALRVDEWLAPFGVR